MTRATLVTSLDASTGKTAVSLAMATIARDRGDEVGYMKPKGTRLQSSVGKTRDEDPLLATEILGLESELAELEPVVYSPTFVEQVLRGREDPAAVRDRVREAAEALAADRDLMVIEGADRIATGQVAELSDPELAALLEADVVLVAGYDRPGDLDELLAAAETVGDRLRGILFNDVPESALDSLEDDAIPFLEARGVSTLGVVPHQPDMAGVSVADLARELGAEVLVEGREATVERFLVGAMSGEQALGYFRRARASAVITGGERAEIHTAAIEAPGVECLVLTGGHRPPSAVLGKASDAGLSVLLVGTDTLTAVERAEDVVRSGRTRDAATVERMAELLGAHADVDALVK